MSSSAFQLSLVSGLSLALGLALSSKDAVSYPATAVSTGNNPVVSFGGEVAGGTEDIVITAPADQDLVITDAILLSTTDSRCKRAHRTDLRLSGGDVLARMVTNSPYIDRHYYGSVADTGSAGFFLGSGIRVPAGDSLTMEVAQRWAYGENCYGASGDYAVYYTLSGYLAQP